MIAFTVDGAGETPSASAFDGALAKPIVWAEPVRPLSSPPRAHCAMCVRRQPTQQIASMTRLPMRSAANPTSVNIGFAA